MKWGREHRATAGLVVLSALALPGCAGAPPEPVERPTIIYPSPPAEPRIQYLTSFTGAGDIEEESGPSFLERVAGGHEDTPEGKDVIAKPYGVAAGDGVIYVCDTALPGIDVIDLQRREFEHWRPGNLGQLQKPINCHVDREDGYLYVADIGRGQVVVFDSNREYVGAIGTGEDEEPSDVFTSAGRVFVADLTSQQIRIYAKPDYRLLGEIPGVEADSASRLYGPTNIWVEGERLYVSNFGAWEVKVFTLDGTYERSVGSYGVSVGQFARPKGIAVDREGVLYVVDAAFENVQMFNDDGQILMFFGGSYRGPGDMWLPAKVSIDYDNLSWFESYVDPRFQLSYLIYVTNQFGPAKLNVYGRVLPREERILPKEEQGES